MSMPAEPFQTGLEGSGYDAKGALDAATTTSSSPTTHSRENSMDDQTTPMDDVITTPPSVSSPEATPTIGARAVHPLAGLLPAMTTDEYDRLKEDIRKNGVQVPVVVLNDQILDGRHRAGICDELGIDYPVRLLDGADPAAVVASLNLHRRNLRPDQVAAIAELLRAEMPEPHVRPETPRRIGKEAAEVAKTLGVSRATVERARAVAKKAPGKLRAVAAGATTANKVLREMKKTKT